MKYKEKHEEKIALAKKVESGAKKTDLSIDELNLLQEMISENKERSKEIAKDRNPENK